MFSSIPPTKMARSKTRCPLLGRVKMNHTEFGDVKGIHPWSRAVHIRCCFSNSAFSAISWASARSWRVRTSRCSLGGSQSP